MKLKNLNCYKTKKKKSITYKTKKNQIVTTLKLRQIGDAVKQ